MTVADENSSQNLLLSGPELSVFLLSDSPTLTQTLTLLPVPVPLTPNPYPYLYLMTPCQHDMMHSSSVRVFSKLFPRDKDREMNNECLDL